MQPFRSMDLEALESTVVRPYTRELYVFAKVVSSFSAEPAIVTGHAGFDCYSIACFSAEGQRSCPIFCFFLLLVVVYSFALSTFPFFVTRSSLSSALSSSKTFLHSERGKLLLEAGSRQQQTSTDIDEKMKGTYQPQDP